MSDDQIQVSAREQAAGEILARIGQITRALRDGLRELGLDHQVALAAEVIPDARDRLKYIATLSERAAERALNAVDVAQPLQDKLGASARGLGLRWEAWIADPAALAPAAPLIADTVAYLRAVPEHAAKTNAQLMEIMMAQDFQDLTGQVIKKMMEVISQLETGLLQVLIDHSVTGASVQPSPSLSNGPQFRPQAAGVASQSEADDLLASLGF